MMELGRIKRDGEGLKMYFQKEWCKNKDFPFKLGDDVIIATNPKNPQSIIIKKIDKKTLETYMK